MGEREGRDMHMPGRADEGETMQKMQNVFGDIYRDLYNIDLSGIDVSDDCKTGSFDTEEAARRRRGDTGSGAGAAGTDDADPSACGAGGELFTETGDPSAIRAAKEEAGVKTPEEKEPETDPMDDLNALIGLTSIKHDVRELYDFTKIQKMRQDAGMKTVPVSKHLVFSGNPGTGKTTVARILARLYKQIGVLSGGQLIEVDRSGLVAGYVGQTATKTMKKIEEAMGGVLFIDEAYTLSRAGDASNDFGQEAIDTILKAMEDHRDEFIVIVAGYTRPMEVFLNSNPGLKSRFNKFIEFPDYTIEELMQIFDGNCREYQYVIDEEARDQVRSLIMLAKSGTPENFANAREVRNLFERIITNQARRIAQMDAPTPEDMQRITIDDLRDENDESGREAR